MTTAEAVLVSVVFVVQFALIGWECRKIRELRRDVGRTGH